MVLPPRMIKKPEPVTFKKTIEKQVVTYTEGQDCPRCGGSGSILMVGDAHRSSGWVPCRAQFGKLDCVRGILKNWRNK